MASKSKKATPAAAAPPRPTSPLSPTRHSRMQEKAELQNLNDRLACYIDRVRYLESENSKLTREIQTTQETVTREVTNIKSMYDNELADARKYLDEIHREKAKLEIDIKRLWEENEELKADLAKKTKDLLLAENSAKVYETRCHDLQHKYNQANADAKKAASDAKELEKLVEKLKKQNDELKKRLENESLARVDVENNNQTLREELSFKDQIYQQQLAETRTKRQVEISEIDGRLSEKYEAKLQDALQELREQYESRMAENRAEIEGLYENKIKGLQTAANRHSIAAANAVDELREIRTKTDVLHSRVTDLENQNSALLSRNRDLEKQLENERMRHAEDLAALEQELAHLRGEMNQQLQDYKDLMDIKVSLDLEISTYRKMLEGEELRLQITPSQVSQQESSRSSRGGSQRRTPVRMAGKRKRTLLDESQEISMSDYSINSSSKGDIEVGEVCSEGGFVTLRNKGASDLALGGWTVVRRCGEQEVTFKFHRSAKLESGAEVTLWSSDSGHDNEPPRHILTKNLRWPVADNMTTLVLNKQGEEIAISERVKRQIASSSSRHREMGGYLGSEELHHQQGDPQGEEKCRLM